MNASLLTGPNWSSPSFCTSNEKFDTSDEPHASDSSIWWDSLESLEEEEEMGSDCGSKTDPMIQVTTPATYNSYGISDKFFDS